MNYSQAMRAATALLGGLGTLACSSLEPGERVPNEHVLMVNRGGEAVDPNDRPFPLVGSYRELTEAEFEAQLDGMDVHITEYALRFKPTVETESPAPPTGSNAAQEQRPMTSLSAVRENAAKVEQEMAPAIAGDAKQSEESGGRRTAPGRARVVVFIHGGLNSQAGSIERAMSLYKQMLDDGVYPVFVNWQSSFFSSYGDHLFLVRNSHEDRLFSLVSFPFVFVADVVRAIGRAPMTIYHEFHSMRRTTWFYPSKNQQIARQVARAAELADDDGSGSAFDVDLPIARRNDGGGVVTLLRDLLIALPHSAVGILIDVGGTPSWEEMHRRTTLILEPERRYMAGTLPPPDLAPVPRFFRRLSELQDKLRDSEGIDLQVDLVCHSMGCIISNLLLQNSRFSGGDVNGERGPSVALMPRFMNIVYMADADAVQVTEQAVYPHLFDSINTDTHLYQLSLHDRSEVAELNACYLTPKGSLLVWIDQMFAPTPSLPDQRAGKLINQMLAMHRVPPTLRERVHYKSFEFESDMPRSNPVVHGDFSKGQFWREVYFVPRSHDKRVAGRGDYR